VFFYYNFKRDEFFAHYHKRSNVETTFSMIKSKFGERVEKQDRDRASKRSTLQGALS